jgi:hypothetical protein
LPCGHGGDLSDRAENGHQAAVPDAGRHMTVGHQAGQHECHSAWPTVGGVAFTVGKA